MPTTFTAWVDYTPRLSFEDLNRRRFFPAYISVEPGDEGAHFDPIECCKTVSKEGREITFEYLCADSRFTSVEDILVKMDHLGLRPALYEELLGFAKKYPDEQLKHPITALGSEVIVDGCRLVASLLTRRLSRLLSLSKAEYGWSNDERFLVVRK